MPNNKALEKEIKEMIKVLNKQTGAKLSYKKLYEDIESALLDYKSASRDDELLAIYTQGITALSDKLLTKHSAITSNPILREKYKGDPAETYTITVASKQMNDLMMKIFELQDKDMAAGFVWSDKQLNAAREYERLALRGRSLYDEWPKCLKEWDHSCFYKDIENIDKTFNSEELVNEPYKYVKNRENDKDVKAAELYYKAKIIKDEIDGYGFFTRLYNRIFNYKKMNAYAAYLAKADETLTKIGFDPERHGGSAESILYKKIMPPHEIDLKYLESQSEHRDLEHEQAIQNKHNTAIFTSENTEEQVREHYEFLKQQAQDIMRAEEEKYFADFNSKKSPQVEPKSKNDAVQKKL